MMFASCLPFLRVMSCCFFFFPEGIFVTVIHCSFMMVIRNNMQSCFFFLQGVGGALSASGSSHVRVDGDLEPGKKLA